MTVLHAVPQQYLGFLYMYPQIKFLKCIVKTNRLYKVTGSRIHFTTGNIAEMARDGLEMLLLQTTNRKSYSLMNSSSSDSIVQQWKRFRLT